MFSRARALCDGLLRRPLSRTALNRVNHKISLCLCASVAGGRESLESEMKFGEIYWMPITLYLPSILRPYASGAEALTITQPVHTIAELLIALERRAPRLAAGLDDSVFNFAVNDELLLHRARDRRLADGDVVEIIPTISGG